MWLDFVVDPLQLKMPVLGSAGKRFLQQLVKSQQLFAVLEEFTAMAVTQPSFGHLKIGVRVECAIKSASVLMNSSDPGSPLSLLELVPLGRSDDAAQDLVPKAKPAPRSVVFVIKLRRLTAGIS